MKYLIFAVPVYIMSLLALGIELNIDDGPFQYFVKPAGVIVSTSIFLVLSAGRDVDEKNRGKVQELEMLFTLLSGGYIFNWLTSLSFSPYSEIGALFQPENINQFWLIITYQTIIRALINYKKAKS